MQDAGRQQRKLVSLAVEDDRVAGVIASLVADDDVVLVGEQIDDLALRLVPPLQADHRCGGHRFGPLFSCNQACNSLAARTCPNRNVEGRNSHWTSTVYLIATLSGPGPLAPQRKLSSIASNTADWANSSPDLYPPRR